MHLHDQLESRAWSWTFGLGPTPVCRYVVVPTVTVLAVMKARLTGATKGHALLKKKVGVPLN